MGRQPFRQMPPVSTIDTVIDVALDHVKTYRRLCYLTASIALLSVVAAVATSNEQSWYQNLTKLAASGGSALLSLFPYKLRLIWQARLRVCMNFRAIALGADSVSEEIRSRMSEKFWREYDRWWKISQ